MWRRNLMGHIPFVSADIVVNRDFVARCCKGLGEKTKFPVHRVASTLGLLTIVTKKAIKSLKSLGILGPKGDMLRRVVNVGVDDEGALVVDKTMLRAGLDTERARAKETMQALDLQLSGLSHEQEVVRITDTFSFEAAKSFEGENTLSTETRKRLAFLKPKEAANVKAKIQDKGEKVGKKPMSKQAGRRFWRRWWRELQ